jgi:tRNA pseudouridine32 synthase / 23S rRNA pseudouridine746 synthase
MDRSHNTYFIPELEVLYSDESLLVVNKPAGLLTIQDGYNPQLPYVSQILQEKFGRLWIVHRLDKDTSGVLLLARSAQAHRSLNIQFENRQTRKEYTAIVTGIPSWQEYQMNLPLRVNGDRKHRTVIDPIKGKPASTDFIVRERYSSCANISALPHSGYTHQIRAHLAKAGFPILFDPLYNSEPGIPADKFPLDYQPRMALHAVSIWVSHPLSNETIHLSAPLPLDMLTLITILKSQ